MDDKERAELKISIAKKIEKSQADILKLEEVTQPIKPENSLGRVSRMDAINNKSINEAALRTARQKHNKLEYAYKRIDDPAFGFCSQCGNGIHPRRILFMPESTFCMNCAKRQ